MSIPRFVWFTLPVLALAALPGCGDDVETGGPGSDTGRPIDDVPQALAEGLCASIQSCYGDFADVIYRGTDCVVDTAADIRDASLPIWKADIAAGTVVYDGTKVQACADAIAAMGCALRSERLASVCDEALAGNVPAGGACQGNVECDGARYCAFTGATCPGVCTDLEAEGSPCTDNDACQNGLVCLVDAASGQGTCASLADEGEACSNDGECDGGLGCVGADAMTGALGTCETWASRFTEAEGDGCDPQGGQLCATGLSCVLDQFSAGSGASFSCSAPFASGAACKVGFPNGCPADEYCNADLKTGQLDGVCTPSPLEGEPCYDSGLGNGAIAPCAPGLACNPNGICEGTGVIGETCTTEDFCHSGVCTSGVCASPDRCQAE